MFFVRRHLMNDDRLEVLDIINLWRRHFIFNAFFTTNPLVQTTAIQINTNNQFGDI